MRRVPGSLSVPLFLLVGCAGESGRQPGMGGDLASDSGDGDTEGGTDDAGDSTDADDTGGGEETDTGEEMDDCPDDPDKTDPGLCGCSIPEGECCVVPEFSLHDDPNMETILQYIEKNLITDGTGFDMGPDPYTLVVNDLDWARPTGATMSVVKNGDLYGADAVGYTAKPGHPLRQEMNRDTIIRIGSTSKLVTGAGASALRDLGMVDFDAPVSTYMPFLELTYGRENQITMRHLLNQTASMFHHYPMCGGSGGVAPYEQYTGSATEFWTEPPRLPIDYVGWDWTFIDPNNSVLYFDFRCPTTHANLGLPGTHDEQCYYTSADSSLPIHDAMYDPASDLQPHTTHPDDATWRYGNGNLLLAQGALEGATGENFRTLQQRHLFNKAGMCRTTYDGDAVVEMGNYYQGYDFGWQANFNGINTCNQGNGTDFEICSHTQDEGNLHGCGAAPGPANAWKGVTCHPPDIDPMTWDAMGGLFSTSVDMGLLAAALLNDYTSGTSSFDPDINVILSGEKARDMMGATPQTKVPIPSDYPQYENGQYYGFGTFLKTASGKTFVQHGGGGPGNSHIFIMEPESGWAVDLSFNSWNIWDNQKHSVGKKRLVEVLIECYFSGYAHDVYDGVGNANGGKGNLVGLCTGTP